MILTFDVKNKYSFTGFDSIKCETFFKHPYNHVFFNFIKVYFLHYETRRYSISGTFQDKTPHFLKAECVGCGEGQIGGWKLHIVAIIVLELWSFSSPGNNIPSVLVS